MRHGTIVETAPAIDLFAHPQHPYTRLLLDSSLADAPFRSEVIA
jgi:peptide/nickel transport system permease protein